MVSTLNLDEKYNRVRRNFCFYLDIQDNGLARSISRRIQDMGLQEEVFLTPRVSHIVRDRIPSGGGAVGAAPCRRREGRARSDAMLQRVHPNTHTQLHTNCVHLTVQKAINLLDKLYDTFFTAQRKAHVRLFSKPFIKIEFLDKVCRPVYKEFDEWPEISLELDPNREKKERKESPNIIVNLHNCSNNTTGQKMTRKSRPRIKEKDEKEQKGGYCEMCNTDYVDATLHRRSPHHLAFVRDHTNFLALDSLISSGTDVTTFLDKATPVNGERRSLRKMCNGDVEQPKNKRLKSSISPDSTVNGNVSPKRNGGLEDERKHNTRCSRKTDAQDERQYYKVVSTKLRSSGSFQTKKKDTLPTCNGTKPLVVKFRKVRRSELSVLSDEAEQFMFPKRASSTSSTSSEEEKEVIARRKSPPRPPPVDRRRLARPVALKEESSEEDSWPEENRRRKRRVAIATKRSRRVPCKTAEVQKESQPIEVPTETTTQPEPEVVNPLREEPIERCMKWEDGKLKYTPAVEQLEFAFESVPYSEPWYETFKRQDQDKILTRNVPQYFALYSKSPKLPYEIGQLPPLKPNCCPLSDFVKREERAGPSRSYGTRGMKRQKIRKRTTAVIALEGHPRKSPREHASTLAILGSAGLLNRRKHTEDSKSTASEDTISDIQSNMKVEPIISETQEASERLQQFLSEVFEDAAEYDLSDNVMEGDATVTTSTNIPDVSSLVSECERCDLIRNEMKESVSKPKSRRGKFKKKNRTGWPNKRKQKKDSRANSMESVKLDSLDHTSSEPPDDDTTQDTISEEDTTLSETEHEKTVIEKHSEDSQDKSLATLIAAKNLEAKEDKNNVPAKAEENTKLDTDDKSNSEEDKELKKKKRALQGLCDWLQPVVRVARVDPTTARRLRSAGRIRSSRFR